MKLALVLSAAIGTGLFAVGCSSSSSSDAPSGPVSASPLTGSIDGQDFTAKVAIARKGFDDGKKSIDIYDDASITCDTFNDKATRKILIDVPWQTGMSKDFSFSFSGGGQTATFVIDKGGTPDNIIATTGRVEILDAPTDVGSTGKMRLRAIAEGNKVEGEIPVQVCE